MSRESDRATPTVHDRTRPTWTSGANALTLSARLMLTAIGYVGSGLNVAGTRRLVCDSNTGHDSPGPTSPVFALRVSEIDAPRLPPYRPVKRVSPWRS